MSPENPIGKPFFELNEVDSTNNYAMQMLQAQMAEHGFTCFAHYQNAGKGQRGKTWKAEPGQNITMTIVMQPSFLSLDNQFILNAAVSLAAYHFFNTYAIDQTSIKWPNDIYWRDRKAGGILIENLVQGSDWKFAIVGIGININQPAFPPALTNAVSLRQITGKSYDVVQMAKELCKHLQHWWDHLSSGQFIEVLDAYNSTLFRRNEEATLNINGTTVKAEILGANQKGELAVIVAGQQRLLKTGEAIWVLAK